MIRSTKVSIKFANKNKKDTLVQIIDEYRRVVSFFINSLFNLQLFDKEIEDYLQDPYGDVSCWIELQYKIKEELKGRAR